MWQPAQRSQVCRPGTRSPFRGKATVGGDCFDAFRTAAGALAPQLFFDSLDGPVTAALDAGVLTLNDGKTVLTLARSGTRYVDPKAGDKLRALLTSTHLAAAPDPARGGRSWPTRSRWC